MADVKSVSVRLTAMNDQYKSAMRESGDATKAFGMTSTVALAAAGAAAVAFVKSSADAYVQYGREVIKLQRMTGDSAEAMSKFAFAGQQSGLSSDKLAGGLRFLEKAMEGNSEWFGKLNVQTRDSSGNFRNAHAVFLDTAESLSKMTDVTSRNVAVTKLFGRAGLELLPMLLKGRDGLLELEAEAEKYGLVLGADNIVAIKQNIQAHRELDAAWKGVQVRVGAQVLPALTSGTEWLGKMALAASDNIVPIEAVGGALIGVGFVAPKVVSMFQSITAESGAMGVGLTAGALVGIVAVSAAMKSIEEDSKRVQTELSGSIDWSSYEKSADGINKEGAAVAKLGEAWNKKSAIEKLTHAGEYKIYADAQAQYEQDLAHHTEMQHRIEDLGRTLGITGAAAQSMADKLHVDLSGIDPSTYTPIFQALANGSITAATAEDMLSEAQRNTAETADEAAKRIEEEHKAIKAKADYEMGLFNPELAMLNAQQSVKDAQGRAREAGFNVLAKQAALAQAQRNYPRGGQVVMDAMAELQKAKEDEAKANQDTVKANLDLDTSVRNLAQSYRENGTTLEEQKAHLDSWVEHGTITKDAADKMALAFLGVYIAVKNTSGAIDELDGKSATVNVKMQYPGDDANGNPYGGIGPRNPDAGKYPGDNPDGTPSGGIGPRNPGQATGGNLLDGWTPVGELGTELLYKQGNRVTVHSASDSRRMLTPHPAVASGASGGSQAPSGGYTHNGNIIIQGNATAETARDIAYEQRKHAALGRLG